MQCKMVVCATFSVSLARAPPDGVRSCDVLSAGGVTVNSTESGDLCECVFVRVSLCVRVCGTRNGGVPGVILYSGVSRVQG